MREILFRGKRCDNGEWVEGFLYVTHNGEYEIGYYSAELNIERVTFVVDPATVGQYTGLTDDKNGKKIFEGDIVRKVITTTGGTDMGVVSYADGAFGVKSQFGAYFLTFFENSEIIGNIHDNPALLRQV